MSIIIGIDHGYYAIKTAHCSFPAGLTSYFSVTLTYTDSETSLTKALHRQNRQ